MSNVTLHCNCGQFKWRIPSGSFTIYLSRVAVSLIAVLVKNVSLFFIFILFLFLTNENLDVKGLRWIALWLGNVWGLFSMLCKFMWNYKLVYSLH